MSPPPFQSGAAAQEAARYIIPCQRIVSVEHPCIVKNVDKAVQMLGGDSAVSEVLDYASRKTLPLKFMPEGQSILSINNPTNNILLQISVPKRIGKRKRGSDEPFQPVEASEVQDAQHLLRSIKDNPERAEVSSLGVIENSHIYRTLPDFEYSTADSKFKAELNSRLIGQNLSTIKTFQMPEFNGPERTEIFPPPVLSINSLPQAYAYVDKQSSKPKPTTVDGTNYSRTAHARDGKWPTGYGETSTRLLHRPQPVQDIHPTLRELFTRRPIWSLDALASHLDPKIKDITIRKAASHLAFEILSGPWNNTFCLYGTDPRTSAAGAKYQTVALPRREWLQQPLTEEVNQHASFADDDHVNNAPPPPPTNPLSLLFAYSPRPGQSTIQLVDILDTEISTLVNQPAASLRAECDRARDGWYDAGVLAKVEGLLREKLGILDDGTRQQQQ